MTTVSDRFRVRRGTAADLAAVNEVPLDSEFVLERDTRRLKIGDGTTAYNALPYIIDLNALAAKLAGLSTSSASTVSTADSILQAIGKLQAQISAFGGSGGGGGSGGIGLLPYSYAEPDFADVSTLQHFEGSNGSTTITDEVGANTWTAHGGAQISTAWDAFGTASLEVPSGSNSSISCPTSSAFDVGAGDWTLQFRYKYIGAPQAFARIFQSQDGDGNAGISLLMVSGTTTIALWLSNSSFGDILNGETLATLSTTDVSEVLVERVGNEIICAVNGFVVHTASIAPGSSIYYNSADNVIVGGNATGTSRSVNAYLDELRFVKGVAVLTPNRAYSDPGEFANS